MSVIMITHWLMILVHKENYSVGEEYFKHVQGCCHTFGINVVATWNDLHEVVELQSEIQHALDVVSVGHENVECPLNVMYSPLWVM